MLEQIIGIKKTPEYKSSKYRQNIVILRSIIYIVILGAIVYLLWRNQGLFTGISFLGAAFVVALSGFISSLAAYFYIKTSALFEVNDIVHTGSAPNNISWEVENIGIFFTTLKELDNGLLFTGKTISFPNNIIFHSGVFNSTKKDTLIWQDFTYTLAIWNKDPKHTIESFIKIITTAYQDKINHRTKSNNPKIIYTITDKGLEFHIRLFVNFDKMIETNNYIMDQIILAHQRWDIKLVTSKDSDWLDTI